VGDPRPKPAPSQGAQVGNSALVERALAGQAQQGRVKPGRGLSGVVAVSMTALLLFLLLNSIIAYRNLQLVIDGQRAVAQTGETLINLQSLFSYLQDAETGQRGLLLTSDQAYLAPYEQALGKLGEARASLREKAPSSSYLAERLPELDQAIDAKLAELSVSLEAYKNQSPEAAASIVKTHDGKVAMDKVRDIVSDIQKSELHRRQDLVGEFDAKVGHAVGSLLVSTVVGAGVIALGFYFMQRQIAARQQLAQHLEAANQNKNQFLAMLGHELRNPLAAVRNAIDVLDLVGGLPDTVDEMRQIIERQTTVMSRLVDELLDVARISHGKIEIRKTRLNLVDVVERTVTDVRSAVVRTGVMLELDVDNDEIWIEGDATRISQVVGNLLQNAVKFSDQGDVVRVQLRATNHRQAVISVVDQGFGMSRETLQNVFELYAQGDGATERRAGLGLGLALAKGLVELHGGAIAAHSAGVGKGSTFVVTLPLAAPAPSHGEAETEEFYTHRGRCRVVVIDDRRDSSFTLKRMLELSGHEAYVAEEGPTGVALAIDVKPDIVLCDIDLPGGMSGYDVVGELRAHQEACHALMVAVTGHAENEARQRSLQAGFDLHVVKPISRAQLLEILKALPCDREVRAQPEPATEGPRPQ